MRVKPLADKNASPSWMLSHSRTRLLLSPPRKQQVLRLRSLARTSLRMTSSLEREQIPRSADRLLWLEDLQVEGFCQQTFHGFDPGQGAFEGGVGAGLDGYYEGQIVPSEAGLLEDGV